MHKLKLLMMGLIGLWSILGSANGMIINCFYNTRAHCRADAGKFEPSNIDPTLCTHLTYYSFSVTPDGEIETSDKMFALKRDELSDIMALKSINPNLKVLASVGRYVKSATFSAIAGDPEKMQLFVQSAVEFIDTNGFDGLDICWLYPVLNGGSRSDKRNFVILLQLFQAVFTPLNLILSISASGDEKTVRTSYFAPNIAETVDFINVMAYDYTTPEADVVGFNAPFDCAERKDVRSTINLWQRQGAPASKLVLGLAFYGHSFQLVSAGDFEPGDPISGPGRPGPYTGKSGFMGYNEICLLEKNWFLARDEACDVPFMFNDRQWISFDNVESIEKKVDFGIRYNLAGFMISSIDTDDFQGMCGEKYPLLTAVNKKVYE